MTAVRRYCWFQAFAYSFAWIPVMYPFLTAARGFSNREFFDLNALYYLTMCVFEVPTGILADRFGRKTTLVLGSFGFTAAFTAIYVSSSFGVAAAGMAMMGLAHTLLSGADSAWLYDTLVAEGRAHEYLKVEGRAGFTRMLTISACDVLGGLLAQEIGYFAAFALSIASTAAAGMIALTFVEPPRTRSTRGALGHLAQSCRTSLSTPSLRWILFYSMSLFLLLRVAFHFYQPHMAEIGITSLAAYGWTLGLLNVAAAPFARAAYLIDRRFGERFVMTTLLVVLGASFLLLAGFGTRWSIAFFVLQQIPFGLMMPVTRRFTNRHVPSAERATLLSVQSFAGRLAFGAFAFGIAETVDRLGGVRPLYWIVGSVAMVLAVGFYVTMPREPVNGDSG